jgi:acyl transferase domain-containing protein/NADP-dependent 3-hydroxy acid dehydrogenase YdfG/acyl carrier protein
LEVDDMSNHNRAMIPIAVVGVSALFPGSDDARGFWSDILAGRDLITEVPPSHWLVEDYYDPDPRAVDKTYCKRGAFLSSVDFDPMEFGIPPSILPATDTTQILALVVAQQVLEDASQGQFAAMDRERISVVLGVTSGQQLLGSMNSRLQKPIWLKALRESGIPETEAQAICERIADNYVPWQESSFPGLLGNIVAGRIANRFDLHGTNAVADAACASSMAALSMGINELQLGQSDLVISGGVDTMNDIFMYMCFSKTPALSPTGDCRPFSDNADGTLLGEGICMLALKRLADAERDGDRVYAVIRGIGAASDGRSKSVYAPLPEGQARAMRRAYAMAGYGPETVELIEAHGTATKAGDAAEFAGLRIAFDESGRSDRQWCALGSVKSQIGHTKAAAGAAGLFKAIMALHHKVLPPTIKIERPNPTLEIEKSAFYMNTQARPWIRDQSHPRRASISSFGFGGSNFHVTVEEYVPAGNKGQAAPRFRTSPTELVLLSAPTAADLITRCQALAEKPGELVRVARENQERFNTADRARLAVVAASVTELSDKLSQAVALIEKAPDVPFMTPTGINYAAETANAGGIAFLFPGQGSQYLGMGADVAMSIDHARAAWDTAAATRFEGESIDRVVFPPPTFTAEAREAQERRLTATEWAQMALGVQSVALLNVLHAVGIRPQCLAGHSFGEVTALHAAGAFDEATLLKIARRRGELMRDASSVSGAMSAVVCPIEEVSAVLKDLDSDVVIANHNAPAQCVLSGRTEEIARVEAELAARRITARRLAVATAFHSSLVGSSSTPFQAYLSEVDVAEPVIDVYGCADAAVYPRDPRLIRERLAAQIAQPVRFVDQIEAMYARGIRIFVEVGAGSVLTELVGRILGDREHSAVNLDRKGGNGLTSLQVALGRLAVAGVAMDLRTLWAGHALPSNNTPKKPAMAIPILGTNYGSPYPPAGGARDLPPANPPREIPVDQPHLSAPAAASSEVQHAWVQAYQEAQRQTAEAHAAYQRATAESHLAFLKTTEASFAGLSALLNGGSGTLASAPPLAFEPTPAPIPEPAPQQVIAVPPNLVTPAPVFPASDAPSELQVAMPPSIPAALPVPPADPAVDLEALLLAIVAEKTGYPAEMLGADMELEGDLGIDSIKRVEILSVMNERAPGLPEVKMAELGALRTLGQIAEHMRASQNGSAPPKTGSNGSAPAPAVDLEALLLAIVAEKTGYPAEMLGADMELEGDLGIDSIKRVEILSVMNERAPGLPEVKMAELGALRTLGQIAEHMRASQNGSAPLKTGSNGSAPAAAVVTSASAPGIQRFALREVAASAVGMSLPGIFDAERVVITDDGQGLAGLLAGKLAERGVYATVVSSVPPDANVVVFLGGMREVANVDEAVAVNREAFRAARAVATQFTSETAGVFINVQDTGGDFGLGGRDATRAWLGGICGLVRTAALEWPHASVKNIDCERGGRDLDAIAEAICAEIFEGGSTLDVGLRADGTRTTLTSVATPVQATPSPRLGPESVVVASGGARGITAAGLIALAEAHHPRIVLLGRTQLEPEPAALLGINDDQGLNRALFALAQAESRGSGPAAISAQRERVLANREIRATLEALAAAGSQARYVTIDIRDALEVASALENVRSEWGPITAIVHGAGVISDKLIADKTEQQFDRVFDTKVTGLRALLAATADDPLTVVCLFSSAAARTGNPGQSDYAMANEVLNFVACAERSRRGDTCTVRSIGWGPWEGGMVTARLKKHFEQAGVNLIPLDVGANMLVDEINSASDDVVLVVAGGLGHGPLGANASPASGVAVHVDAQSHAYLADHRIAGTVVVPMVMAVEWMLRGARACRPDLIITSMRNVRVLSGIKLDHFDATGNVFVVNCTQTTDAEIAVELRGASGTLHYNAVVEIATRATVAPPAPAPPELDCSTHTEIYDGHVLFHRQRFQVIKAVAGESDAGIAGTLAGARDLDWPAGPWCVDPAVLDGGLQLATLWTQRVLGGASLPMSFGEVRIYRRGLAEGPITCVVYGRQNHLVRAVCDISFMDETGALIAEMLGVETVLRPEEVQSASSAGLARA